MNDTDLCIDPYTGGLTACDVDPCSSDGVTTLYFVQPCTDGNPPLVEWCQTHQGHPVCVGVVGTPPELPDTGLSNVGGAGLAAVVMLTLGWALLKVSDL